jgi:enamine deaminase RidA (YjgF/YER057c/UK114 family)
MTEVAKIRRIKSPEISEQPDGNFSNCLMVGNIAYISGITPRDQNFQIVDGDEYEQGKAIFSKIKMIVGSAGGRMSDVVRITIFVTDINQRAKFWQARREFFSGDFPTATMVQVAALAEPKFKVEVDAIAHIGAGPR